MKIWLLKSSFALNSSHIDTLCTLLNLEFPKLKLSKVQFVYILFCFRNTQYKFLHILRIRKLKTSKQCGISTRICHLNGFKVRSSQRKTKKQPDGQDDNTQNRKKGFLWLILRSIEVLANHSPMIFKQYLGYNKIWDMREVINIWYGIN